MALVAQSPLATIGRAVAVDPKEDLPLTQELCSDAPHVRAANGQGWVYGLQSGQLPAPVTVIETPNADPAGQAHVADLIAQGFAIDRVAAAAGETKALTAALERASRAGGCTGRRCPGRPAAGGASRGGPPRHHGHRAVGRRRLARHRPRAGTSALAGRRTDHWNRFAALFLDAQAARDHGRGPDPHHRPLQQDLERSPCRLDRLFVRGRRAACSL